MDVIVGMDWLNKFEALNDFKQKILRYQTPSGREITI